MAHHREGTAEPGGADEVAATRDALPADHDELNQNSHLDIRGQHEVDRDE